MKQFTQIPKNFFQGLLLKGVIAFLTISTLLVITIISALVMLSYQVNPIVVAAVCCLPWIIALTIVLILHARAHRKLRNNYMLLHVFLTQGGWKGLLFSNLLQLVKKPYRRRHDD